MGPHGNPLAKIAYGAALKILIDPYSPKTDRTVYVVTWDRVYVYEHGAWRGNEPIPGTKQVIEAAGILLGRRAGSLCIDRAPLRRSGAEDPGRADGVTRPRRYLDTGQSRHARQPGRPLDVARLARAGDGGGPPGSAVPFLFAVTPKIRPESRLFRCGTHVGWRRHLGIPVEERIETAGQYSRRLANRAIRNVLGRESAVDGVAEESVARRRSGANHAQPGRRQDVGRRVFPPDTRTAMPQRGST